MKDRIPVNPGRVLITPENGSAAYYATMTRADNPTQEGTPLNKASLLKDATANKFGLGVDAVPDDVLSLLSRFHNGLGNEYVWEKSHFGQTWGELQLTVICYGSASGWGRLKYADSIDDNGNLVSEQSINVDNGELAANANIVKGKYWRFENYSANGGANGTYFTPEDASNAVSSLESGTYYLRITAQQYLGIGTTIDGYVNSPDPDAYPVEDGYTYAALGQLGAKVQIATGSYAATGTYGSNNPNSLTFDFVPKIFAIAVQYSANNQSNSQIFVLPKANGSTGNAGGSCSISTWEYTKKVYTYASADGKTVYWYSPDSATHQMNQSGFTYAYFAIG